MGTDVPWCHGVCVGGQETTFLELVLFFYLVKAVSLVSAMLCYEIQANWSMNTQVILLSLLLIWP